MIARARRQLRSLAPGAWPAVVAAAVVLGAVSGLAASLLRLFFRALEWVFTRHTHELPLAALALKPWWRVAVPVLGGLAAAAVLSLRERFGRRNGAHAADYNEYVEAVRLRGGFIPLLPNLWRTASSASSVATGAAIGREGSMIQFAATMASLLRRSDRVQWMRCMPGNLAVACGVAAGVTAAYQAPVAGVLFAAEIVLGELRMAEVAPLAVAAFAGWQVSRLLLEPGPLYPVRQGFPAAYVGTLHAGALWALPLLAAALGALSPAYQRALQMFRGLRRLPLALAWGGLAVGLASLWDVRAWGNGDTALAGALGMGAAHGGLGVGVRAMASLLAVRLLVTAFDVGVGTVGGVFTPTLFAGATVGLLAASGLQAMGRSADATLFAIAGMSALIAAATHAPLMAAAMAAELTGQWRLFPLLLLLDVLAWLVARQLSQEALYAIASQAPVHKGLAPPHRGWIGALRRRRS